jgi:ribonuclease P protein component
LGEFSLTKAERILKRSDFNRLSKFGEKLQDRHFIVLFCPGQTNRARLGITVSRKVGNAVKRNRIKRLSREFFRLNRKLLGGNWDVNIIAKKDFGELTSEQVFLSLNSMFRKIIRRHSH